MTRDDWLAELLAERYGPPPRPPAADDELTRARRRRALNDAMPDARQHDSRDVHTREEAV